MAGGGGAALDLPLLRKLWLVAVILFVGETRPLYFERRVVFSSAYDRPRLALWVAESADADHVVELINQAKIFRYILAPFKPQKLKFFIDSALAQFHRYRAAPALLGDQRTDVAAAKATSGTAALIRNRLRALRVLFAPRVAAGR